MIPNRKTCAREHEHRHVNETKHTRKSEALLLISVSFSVRRDEVSADKDRHQRSQKTLFSFLLYISLFEERASYAISSDSVVGDFFRLKISPFLFPFSISTTDSHNRKNRHVQSQTIVIGSCFDFLFFVFTVFTCCTDGPRMLLIAVNSMLNFLSLHIHSSSRRSVHSREILHTPAQPPVFIYWC